MINTSQCIDTPFFTHSPFARHLGLALHLSSCDMNVLVSICQVYFFSIGYRCRSRISSSYGRCIFSSKGSCHLFSVIVILITTPLAMCKEFPHSYQLFLYFFNLFANSHSYKSEISLQVLFQLEISYKQNKGLTLISGNYCSKSIDLCRTYKLSGVKR